MIEARGSGEVRSRRRRVGLARRVVALAAVGAGLGGCSGNCPPTFALAVRATATDPVNLSVELCEGIRVYGDAGAQRCAPFPGAPVAPGADDAGVVGAVPPPGHVVWRGVLWQPCRHMPATLRVSAANCSRVVLDMPVIEHPESAEYDTPEALDLSLDCQ